MTERFTDLGWILEHRASVLMHDGTPGGLCRDIEDVVSCDYKCDDIRYMLSGHMWDMAKGEGDYGV